MSKKILILDSSQIDTFLTCPTQWYYNYKRRLIPNNARVNTPMDMGTYGHKLLEIIYKERAKGNEEKAIDVAFAYNLDKETCRCAHSRDYHLQASCESVGCPCQNFDPIEFPLSAADRSFVQDRVLEYTICEGRALPILIPKSPDYVEVGFSYHLYEDENRLFILEGRIDLLGQIANNCPNGWVDHKFQSRERDLYLKSIQFRNYALVTELSIGVVNYIRFAKKVEKDKTFKRSIISFSRIEMDTWKLNLIQIYKRIEEILGLDDWYDIHDKFRNRAACSGKFGYPCDYTKLCEEFHNPELIKIYEKSEYQEKPEWRPW